MTVTERENLLLRILDLDLLLQDITMDAEEVLGDDALADEYTDASVALLKFRSIMKKRLRKVVK